MSSVEIKNLTKYYGRTCALNGIDLTIESGKIYGLLGKNGAGKTTMLNLITNRLFPTEGTIFIDGEAVLENDKALGKVFYMTEKNLYPDTMKVRDMFKWTKSFYPKFDLDYAAELCQKFKLDTGKKIKALSTGYSSIAKLIAALSSNAQILIFDEPVLGLDATHRDLFYKLIIQSYIANPKTIIISTHIIEEISDLIERVVIINNKKIIIDDSVENLLASGYSVSGPKATVESFISGRRCIATDCLSGFSRAALIGKLTSEEKAQAQQQGLEITGMELQQMFIYLTQEDLSL